MVPNRPATSKVLITSVNAKTQTIMWTFGFWLADALAAMVLMIYIAEPADVTKIIMDITRARAGDSCG